MNILVTGNKNGLGKYVFENIGSVGWDKDMSNKQKEALQKEGVDVIIHCAFNSLPEVASQDLSSYLQDTIFLTKEVVQIPHKKCIFISSVDVYPKNEQMHREDEVINPSQVKGIYGLMKLFSEAIVQEYASSFLIIRSAAFLGSYMRNNSFKKIREDDKPMLTLTADSHMNYVLYEDVLEFIKIAIEKDLQGIYNIASSENIRLSEITTAFPEDIEFGQYHYNVGNIDNTKAAAIVPAFNKTSTEVVKKYL